MTQVRAIKLARVNIFVVCRLLFCCPRPENHTKFQKLRPKTPTLNIHVDKKILTWADSTVASLRPVSQKSRKRFLPGDMQFVKVGLCLNVPLTPEKTKELQSFIPLMKGLDFEDTRWICVIQNTLEKFWDIRGTCPKVAGP